MISVADNLILRFQVTLVSGGAPSYPMEITFTQSGGTVGRRAENDWVLPDTQRFISGCHAVVSFQGGQFYITDTSVNGLFLNHSQSPLGKDNQQPLQNGDILVIGEYTIITSLEEQSSSGGMLQSEVSHDPFAGISQDIIDDPSDGTFPRNEPSQVLDQIPADLGSDLLGGFTPTLGEAEFDLPPTANTQASEPDHLSELEECFQPANAIPENWAEDTGFAEEEIKAPADPLLQNKPAEEPQIVEPSHDPAPFHATPEPIPAEIIPSDPEPFQATSEPILPEFIPPDPEPFQAASAPIQAQPESIPPTPAPARRIPTPPAQTSGGADEQQLRHALARGLQLPENSLDNLPLAKVLENLGQITRANLEGTMAILRARAEIKGEFRMSQTIIQPQENNPLKFSIGVDEALKHIISPEPGKGYLAPIQSIHEANEDIEAHMLAVMAGMQAALKVVITRFKPEELETRLGQSAVLLKLPLYKQAKKWDLFKDLYSEIAREVEDDFHVLFGDAFAKAYSEQVYRLELLKRENAHANPIPPGQFK